MVALGLEISGDRQLSRRLRALGSKQIIQVLNRGARRAFQPILLATKARTPKRSGALVDSLGIQRKTSKRDGTITLAVLPRRTFKRTLSPDNRVQFKSGHNASTVNNIFIDSIGEHRAITKTYVHPRIYARYIEFGAPGPRGVRRRAGGASMFRDGLRAKRSTTLSLLRGEIDSAITRVTRTPK